MKTRLAILAIGLATLLVSGCITYGMPGLVSGVFLVQARIVAAETEGTIVLVPRPAAYRALRFEVEGPPVIIYRVVIIYHDGFREDLPVSWVVDRGRWDRSLDLGARGRPVERVMLYFRPSSQRGHEENGHRYQEAQADVVRVYGVE